MKTKYTLWMALHWLISSSKDSVLQTVCMWNFGILFANSHWIRKLLQTIITKPIIYQHVVGYERLWNHLMRIWIWIWIGYISNVRFGYMIWIYIHFQFEDLDRILYPKNADLPQACPFIDKQEFSQIPVILNRSTFLLCS